MGVDFSPLLPDAMGSYLCEHVRLLIYGLYHSGNRALVGRGLLLSCYHAEPTCIELAGSEPSGANSAIGSGYSC